MLQTLAIAWLVLLLFIALAVAGFSPYRSARIAALVVLGIGLYIIIVYLLLHLSLLL